MYALSLVPGIGLLLLSPTIIGIALNPLPVSQLEFGQLDLCGIAWTIFAENLSNWATSDSVKISSGINRLLIAKAHKHCQF